jgi:hypothetical protein
LSEDAEVKAFSEKFCTALAQETERLEKAAKDPSLLDRIMLNLSKTVKEDESIKFSVFFCCLSAYTPEPLNLFIRGPTSTGKTYGTVQTSQVFPAKDILYIGAASPKFLIRQHGVLVDSSGKPFTAEKPDKPRKSDYTTTSEYREAVSAYKEEMKEFIDQLHNTYTLIELSGKTIIFLESPNLELFNILRPILSHDKVEMSFPYVDKNSKGQIRTVNVVIRGWPACIVLNAKEQYLEELANRAFTISPLESTSKYEAGNQVTNEFSSFPWEKDAIDKYREEIRTFIEYLKTQIQGKEYALPFDLTAIYPHDLPRDMRDFKHLLQLIQCVTALYAKQRLTLIRDKKEYFVSSLKDVEFSFKKFKGIFETTRTGLSQHILTFYHDIVKEMPIDETSELEAKRRPWRTSELLDKYNEKFSPKRSRRTVLRYLELLEEIGYVSSGEDADDKRSSIWTSIMQQNKEKSAIDDFNALSEDLKPKLEKSLKEWLNRLGHENVDFYSEKTSDGPQYLSWSEAEKIVLCENDSSCLNLVKAETSPKTESEPKESDNQLKTQNAQVKGTVAILNGTSGRREQ